MWNAQALFASDPSKQKAKRDFTTRLINDHDFLGILETHGTQGVEQATQPPTGCRAFWSHGTASVAGIGLVIKQTFLQQFNPTHDDDWVHIVPGRVGRLSLRGALGCLDIVVAYFPTGQEGAHDRMAIMDKMSHHIQSRETTLTVMIGDWNFVLEDNDRFSKATGAWSGAQDRKNAEHWEMRLQTPHKLHELQQPHYTCDQPGVARSRIDRIYTNHFASDQLDRHYSCTVLLWTSLSAHRPISFARATPRPKHSSEKRLPQGPIRHPDWARRVALEYHARTSEDPLNTNPIRRLILAKRAIKDVTMSMQRQGCLAQATEIDDQIGWTMSCIRGAESVDLSRMGRCVKAYPELSNFINPNDPNTRLQPGMTRLRQHAVELSRSSVDLQITKLKRVDAESSNSPYRRNLKEHILTQLRRTMPGTTTTLNAVTTADERVTTDPKEIAAALQDHWGRVFADTQLDGDTIQAWLSSLPNIKGTPSERNPQNAHNAQEPNTTGDASVHRRKRSKPGGRLPQPAGSRRPSIPLDTNAWEVTHKDIQQALDISSNTRPGPDGIPYGAWRALGNLAIDILHGVATTLSNPDSDSMLRQAYHDEAAENEHNYNLSSLICLPKKPSGCDEEVGEYYSPGNTRPLSIVNTDNRLVANAARLHWEQTLVNWVSSNQQGFLPGRSLLSNLITLDSAAMETALRCPDGAIVLFDFKAAFPSLAPEFLFRTLRELGLPDNAINLVRSLYDDNKCSLSFRGTSYPGFAMKSGVRQGCPLSPLLYALAAETLLEQISVSLPGIFVKAYADDTAVVLTDFWTQAPKLAQIFETFAAVSNLHLNLDKCVLIPLHPDGPPPPAHFTDEVSPGHAASTGQSACDTPKAVPPSDMKGGPSNAGQMQQDSANAPLCRSELVLSTLRNRLRRYLEAWSGMKLAWAGQYLGFSVGPGKSDQSWSKPAEKYESRCKLWAGHEHGLQYSAMIYNTLILSTLSFIGQLEMPPDWLYEHERDAFQIMAPGPYRWVQAEDLWHLRQAYGFCRPFLCLRILSQAAQARVFMCDAAMADTSNIRQMTSQLRQSLGCPDMPYTKYVWRDWFDRSFLLRLENTYKEVTETIGPLACFLGGCVNGATNRRPSFQHVVYDELLRKHHYNVEHRLRTLQKRWRLNDRQRHPHSKLVVRTATPAWQAERTLHNLRTLASLTTPRIWAAVFGTICNRWCTARRYQQRHTKHNQCVLRCSATAEDSIEHYCRCPYTRELAARLLRLDPSTQVNMHVFSLCCPDITTQEDLVASAVMIYAVYRATNHFRHHPEHPTTDVFNALRQWAREGAMGDTYTARLLTNRWKPSFAHTPLTGRRHDQQTSRKRGTSPKQQAATTASSSTRRRIDPALSRDYRRQSQPEATQIVTSRTNRTSDAPATGTTNGTHRVEALGARSGSQCSRNNAFPDGPQDTIGRPEAHSEHPPSGHSDTEGGRDFCEPECNEYPTGTHHPICSQYTLG